MVYHLLHKHLIGKPEFPLNGSVKDYEKYKEGVVEI